MVELAKALALHPSVYRVDLLTRLITDPAVGVASYGQRSECLLSRGEGQPLGGAHIVRLPCGPTNKYLPKEELWPHSASVCIEVGKQCTEPFHRHIQTCHRHACPSYCAVREFADRGIAHANATLAAMAEAGRRCELYVVHGEPGIDELMDELRRSMS